MEEKLIPLANVARDLSDEDLRECVMFAAYLAYRRRVLALSSKMFSRPTQLAPDARKRGAKKLKVEIKSFS